MAMSICWMCTNPNETSEHRIKQSDIIEQFGKGPYQGNNALVHVKGDQLRDLQGPDSKLIKYEKNLCTKCNNTLTQPFDKAYENFISWVMNNEANVLKRRVIDFEDVYGNNWQDRQVDLFKYFAKSFGCRIDEIGGIVPFDIVNLIDKKIFQTALCVTFQVNEDVLLLDARYQAIGTQPLICYKDRITGKSTGYECGHHFRWLTIMYWYNYFPLEPVGSRWIADSKFVYIGWYKPLTCEERSIFLNTELDN